MAKKKSKKSLPFLAMPIDSVFHITHPARAVKRAGKKTTEEH